MDTFILLHIKPPGHGRGSSSSPPLYQAQCSLWKNTRNSPGQDSWRRGLNGDISLEPPHSHRSWMSWKSSSAWQSWWSSMAGSLYHHTSQLAYSANHDTDGCLAQSTYDVWGTGHKDEHSLSQINICCLISSWQSHEIDTETIPAL